MTTPRRGRRRSVATRTARRRTEWDNTVTGEVVIAPGAQATVDMTAGFRAADGRKGLTLLRIFGSLTVRAVIANGLHQWVAGIAYVSAEAAGALALPDPAVDGNFPWVWWKGGHIFEATDFSQVHMVDTKGKRNFREADAQIRFQFDNDGVANSIGFSLRLRALYALP